MRIRPKNKDNAQKKRNKQTVSRMTESKKPVISYKDGMKMINLHFSMCRLLMRK